MAQREAVTLESLDGKGNSILIDRATTYEIATDITAPSEARIEMGDNGTWAELKAAISIGRRFRMAINGRSIMAGRMLTRALPISTQGGATVQLSVRTILADAAFASCKTLTIRGATLKDIVLRAYATLGLTEADFQFNADTARNIITGAGKNTGAKVDLETITEQDAMVRPPETVYAFVDRHLRRFGLMHWDGPDGKIVVGKPNDEQPPIYSLQLLRGTPRGNNIMDARRSEDYESVPSEFSVYGQGGGRDYRRAAVKYTLTDPVLSAVPLLRPSMAIDEAIASSSLAEARARREMAQRSLQRESWDILVSGWTYPLNSQIIPWAIDTVSTLRIDVADPVAAPYYCWRATLSGNANEGHTARLTMAAKGVWKL
jgi:prophage tail gpP-like protein